jgi:acetyl esterase/lipase
MTIASASGTSGDNSFTWSLPNRTVLTRDIPYAQGARRMLDICRPRTAAEAPVVVFFYGGGWRSGNKRLYRYLVRALARRGYVAVVPDYRIYPEVRYPDFLDDGAGAVRWVKDNVAAFGGDPQKIFLMGHSAGAHIAAMLAVDQVWLRKTGLMPCRDIAGLIGLAGPYDFLPLRDETLKIIFGGADRPETQPICHVARGAPPALLLTGDADDVVDPGNSIRFAERLRAAGNDAAAVIYPRVGHYNIVAALALSLRFFAPVLRDADAFIARTLRSRRAQAVS